jgi:hypothetical protein
MRMQHIYSKYLEVFACDNAHDAMPRRLCLRRHNAQLVPYQAVHQCALANVRAANNGHKASSEPLFTLSVYQLRIAYRVSAQQSKYTKNSV